MERRRLLIRGIVQGVGFRPFIWRLARRFGLTGWVKNTTAGVVVEVQGASEDIDAFVDAIPREKPPLALITEIESEVISPVEDESGFVILRSDSSRPSITIVPPDIAVCDACLREMRDPTDRRYRYPYINCTDCGPRFTIIKAVPYDRKNTTMADWEMCEDCRREYEDPSDRRFHAQPTACPVCGPTYRLTDMSGNPVPGDPFRQAARLLREGYIVAIKSLGGYNLAVDAENSEAVRRLRLRKHRPTKPFAVMVKDMEHVRRAVLVSPEEERWLKSPQAPILLMRRAQGSPVCYEVAPGHVRLGIFLPYTPVHHLLFDEGAPPYLVMTSANTSGERIIYRDEEAYQKLKDVADFILVGERPIYAFIDDSVGVIFEGEYYHIRRARGFVPYPILLENPSGDTVVAAGADLKAAFGILRENYAIMSQYLGDLEEVSNAEGYRFMLGHFLSLFQVEAVDTLVLDNHPRYFSRRLALEVVDSPGRVVGIYHHHAHALSLMAEHGIKRALGAIYDGTGYGRDGGIWGSEIGVFGLQDFSIHYSFSPLPLVGGDAAIREVWRLKKAVLNLLGEEDEWRGLLASEFVTPSRGMGRIFDAVSAMLGITQVSTYDGEAAIMLQQYAERSDDDGVYRWRVDGGMVDTLFILRQVLDDIRAGVPAEAIARRFHNTIADITIRLLAHLADQTGIRVVLLSGGVWQNILLLGMVTKGLRRLGLDPLVHRKVSPSDEGIALGMLYYGANLGR